MDRYVGTFYVLSVQSLRKSYTYPTYWISFFPGVASLITIVAIKMDHKHHFYRECVRYAWRDSIEQANAVATLFGGLILLLILQHVKPFDVDMEAPTTISGTMAFTLVLALFSVALAWLIIFFVRLLLAPAHLYAQQQIKIAELSSQQRSSDEQKSFPERMPLVDLFRDAKNHGLDFVESGMSILKFAKALRQAGLDGAIDFWGRSSSHIIEQLNRNEPLQRIALDHWKKYHIDWISAVIVKPPGDEISGFVTDNFPVRSYVPGSITGYKDLHVNKTQSLRWLKDNAAQIISMS